MLPPRREAKGVIRHGEHKEHGDGTERRDGDASLGDRIPRSACSPWLAPSGDGPPAEYVNRGYPACGECPARGEATAEQMAESWVWRERFRPKRVRLLLIAESPPRSVVDTPLRHFYHPRGPAPDTLFRAVATALLDAAPAREGGAEAKEAALSRLAAGGYFLLDSAQCPVNHLPARDRRAAIHRCAGAVLRFQVAALALAPEARICLVVRGTVPGAALPVLRELGLVGRVADPAGLPFPGRWPGHREAFQQALREAAVAAGWELPTP